MPEASLDYFSKISGLVEVSKFKDRTLLDIASGPKGGILTLLPSRLKVAVDPLFKTNLREMTSDINALAAMAEKVPIRDNTFDVVFCINALDHMAEPRTAMYEIFRVARKVLILMVHVVSPKRKALHSVFHSTYSRKLAFFRLLKGRRPLSYLIYTCASLLGILFNDEVFRIIQNGYGHPNYFTSSDILNIVAKSGFSIKTLKIIPDEFYRTLKMGYSQ